jgi:uncharacterized membrane protein
LQAQHPLFPPPEAVKAYEQILPGSFDRILKMAEKAQQDHSDTVRSAQKAISRDNSRGHWLGWLVSVIAMGCALYCAIAGLSGVAIIFLGVPVMGVGKALIDSVRAPPKPEQRQQPQQPQEPK